MTPSTLMHSRSDSAQRLLSWCSSKGIHIDKRLSVIRDEITGEFSVFNLSEEAIPVSRTREYPDYVGGFVGPLRISLVVTIPRRWMISIRTCASSESLVTCLADDGIHVPVYGHEAQLALALALYNELYVRAQRSGCGVLTISSVVCSDRCQNGLTIYNLFLRRRCQ